MGGYERPVIARLATIDAPRWSVTWRIGLLIVECGACAEARPDAGWFVATCRNTGSIWQCSARDDDKHDSRAIAARRSDL